MTPSPNVGGFSSQVGLLPRELASKERNKTKAVMKDLHLGDLLTGDQEAEDQGRLDS